MKEIQYIADSAVISENVVLGNGVNVWHNAVIRADHQKIMIGDCTNVQDLCVLHTSPGINLEIGRNVTIGHGAIIHGCSIADDTMIGMGAIIMNHAKIGKHCIIGAGALVTENTVIPDYSVATGHPVIVTRAITEEEIDKINENAKHYVSLGIEYLNVRESKK